jgi:hypothetical protein
MDDIQIPPSVSTIKHSGRTQSFVRDRPIWNKNCLWRTCLLMDQDKMSNLYTEPSIDASYQVLVHLAKRLERRRFFRNQPIRNKNCLWWPCLLMDRDEMRHCNRGLLIGWFLKNVLLYKKKDNSCLTIDICIQNAVISIQISRTKWAIFIEDLP